MLSYAVLWPAGIACPHGQLAPEGRSGAAKRFAVSRSTWMLLRQLWPQQVLWDVQARRDKERQKAKRAAAGGDAAAVADAVKGRWPVMPLGLLACLRCVLRAL